MKENVGPEDQAMRAVVGPLLLTAGYALGGKKGKAAGLVTMIAGVLVTETAITRTCPLNELLGIDTTQPTGRVSTEGPAASTPLPAGAGGYSGQEAAAAGEPAAETGVAEEGTGGRRGYPIDYSNFINAAASLSFIGDEETAEAAVKAVLGILASRLEEPEAMRLAASLPDPLSYENLRGHQVNVADLSVDQYYSSLSSQFHISPDEAQVLAVTILRLVKEALDTDGLRDIERSLPQDWTDLIERV